MTKRKNPAPKIDANEAEPRDPNPNEILALALSSLASGVALPSAERANVDRAVDFLNNLDKSAEDAETASEE